VELVGANSDALRITGSRLDATVLLDNVVRNKVSASLARVTETAAPDRVYLKLENVRGTRDASVLSVYVNAPEGTLPDNHPESLAGSVGLFGLRRASMRDGRHAGMGLSFVLDISEIIDRLHMDRRLSSDALRVTILPDREISEDAAITVGRISLYRQGA
jgi:tyrosinase